jgi:hypothetical protein
MPQNPLSAFVSKIFGTSTLAPILLDTNTSLLLESGGGGTSSTLNVTAAAVIKATPGRLAGIIILVPGTTSGTWTFNDCATTGAATAANTIFTLPYNATTNIAGQIFPLGIICTTGIVISAVPGAGSPRAAILWS